MIMLNVFYRAKPGMREKFVEEVKARGLLDTIRAEEGCGSYGYYAALEDPDCLLLVEQWADDAALDRHQAAPHMAGLQELKDRYLLSTEIRRF